MAVPQVHHPAYIIYRDVAPGEAFDATSPLSFFPPKGSDELFDALREAFPFLKTHSERMRDAIINFLLEERQGEQFELSPATTMESSQLTWPSVSSGSTSNFSSPDLLNFATPASFSHSPQIQQASTASSSQPSPPSLDQMTGVFSLSSNPQPKQRIRRKMTEAEKIEYRKRRIVKACDKCAKRKRKCPHNQAEMKTIPAPSTKPTSPISASSTDPARRQPDPYYPLTFDESFDPTAFGSFGDFNMFDDPLPEVSVDDFFHFEHFEDTSPLFNMNQGRHAQDYPSEVSSTLTYSLHEVKSQTNSLSDQAALSPNSRTHVQNNPSQQRAVRDPRTGGSLHETILSTNPTERQSGRVKDVHDSKSDVPGLNQPIHATDSGSNRSNLLLESTHPSDIRRQRSRPPRSSSQREMALTTTSVSPPSGSSRSATLQGRPQPTRLSNSSVLPTQSPEHGGRNQASLGEGMRRADSLATELFMLRRRLPRTQNCHAESHGNREGISNVVAQPKPGTPTSRGHQSPEQLSAQANGGAYLRLGSESVESTHTSRRTYRGGRAGVQDVTLGQDVASVLAAHSSACVSQDRLSDHVRYKDHHGRLQTQGQGSPQILFALGAMLLLATCFPGISVLGLAVFVAMQISQTAGTAEGIVQCTTKNSSWLSAHTIQDTSDELGFRVLKARQYLRCSGSQVGVGLFQGGPGAWLMGLMYPLKLAPLSFAVV